VRLVYQNGKKEVHYFVNGIHFTDWIGQEEAPASRKAIKMKGRGQIRYLVVYPADVTTPIKSIDLIKGKDSTAPVVMAITVEKPGL
jgi:hypothetical protein